MTFKRPANISIVLEQPLVFGTTFGFEDSNMVLRQEGKNFFFEKSLSTLTVA
jgi:hypothetical protein